MIIHHLVVDSVSWRILLEDMQMAYQQLSAGQMMQLPPKTTSFKHWAERLVAYAQLAEMRQDITYWLAAPRAPVGRLPVDYLGGANTMAVGPYCVCVAERPRNPCPAGKFHRPIKPK